MFMARFTRAFFPNKCFFHDEAVLDRAALSGVGMSSYCMISEGIKPNNPNRGTEIVVGGATGLICGSVFGLVYPLPWVAIISASIGQARDFISKSKLMPKNLF